MLKSAIKSIKTEYEHHMEEKAQEIRKLKREIDLAGN